MHARGNSFILRLRDKFAPSLTLSVNTEDGVLPFGKGDTVPQQVWVRGGYEDADRTLLRARLPRFKCFVDLGANIGIFSLLAAKSIRAGGHVFAFDASPTEFAKLQKTVAWNHLDNLTAENLAVGDGSETEVEIFESVNWNGANSRIGYGRVDDEEYTAQKVRCVSLDDYFANKTERPDFMKIDVDGYETRALRGAKRILDECRPVILIEMMWIAEFSNSSPEMIFDALADHGYDWYGLIDTGQQMDTLFDKPLSRSDLAHRRRVSKARGYPARNMYAVPPERLSMMK